MDEIRLMFAEKAHAASEAANGLMMGGTPAGMVCVPACKSDPLTGVIGVQN